MNRFWNIFGLLVLVMLVTSCSKETFLQEDTEANLSTHKSLNSLTEENGTVEDFRSSLPVFDKPTDEDDGEGSSNEGISDDDDEESDDDKSDKKNKGS